MAPYAGRPLGDRLDPAGEFLVAQREGDQAAGAVVHGGLEEAGARVGGDEDDADGGEAQGDLADQFQRGDGADPFVDDDHLGQFVQGLGGQPGEGVDELGGVGHRGQRLRVGELAGQGGEGPGRVRVTDCREDPGGHAGLSLVLREFVRPVLLGDARVAPGPTSASRTRWANDSA